jgi:hypothetical protein
MAGARTLPGRSDTPLLTAACRFTPSGTARCLGPLRRLALPTTYRIRSRKSTSATWRPASFDSRSPPSENSMMMAVSRRAVKSVPAQVASKARRSSSDSTAFSGSPGAGVLIPAVASRSVSPSLCSQRQNAALRRTTPGRCCSTAFRGPRLTASPASAGGPARPAQLQGDARPASRPGSARRSGRP